MTPLTMPIDVYCPACGEASLMDDLIDEIYPGQSFVFICPKCGTEREIKIEYGEAKNAD